jgi:carbon storage regulator
VLVLSRKVGQRVIIEQGIVITILGASGDSVRVGIEAPRSVQVYREEVYTAMQEANRAAALSPAWAVNALEMLAPLRASDPVPAPSETDSGGSPAYTERVTGAERGTGSSEPT